MPSLSCLSKFEPGQFASDSGNVVIPTADVPFPVEALTVGSASLAFVGTGSSVQVIDAAGLASVAFAGSGAGLADFGTAGTASFAFAGAGISSTDSEMLSEDGDTMITEDGDTMIKEG